MIAHGTGTGMRFSPRLPELDEDRLPGSKFARRAVRRIVVLAGGLALAAIVVMATVSMDIMVEGRGTLEPVSLWPVHSTEAGVITSVHVTTGDTVAEGEILLQLDPLELEGHLGQLELEYRASVLEANQAAATAPLEAERQHAQVAEAQAALIRVRATLRQRMAEYGIEGGVDSVLAGYVAGSHSGLDLAVADVLSAQARYRAQIAAGELLALDRFERERSRIELERLRAEIDLARERLERLTLHSPTDGIVLTEQVERLVGSHVLAGGLILEIAAAGAEAEAWRAVLLVEGRDVNRIRIGDPVKVEVEALRETPSGMLEGRVTFVAPQPVGGQSVGDEQVGGPSSPFFRVEATLDPGALDANGVDSFRRGYSVRAHIVTRSGRILRILWLKLTEKLRIE